ncbi:Alpha/beta-hydrolase [Mycena venus]|uniref:Alpha/beta-hydrolase n=1 Tax=Mycena venus TaxID=2733690 RepID=A0A8H6WX08_9AGAR|nr:Alpha/beta-hydrolase [Mycena venus]
MPSSDVKILSSTDGTRIFAEATGDPSNLHLVLLSGLTLSGCVFDDMCADQRLLDSLYVVRYDIRGHGRSGKPNTKEAYESKLFADDFKTVVDTFKLNKPVLVGWSMGGKPKVVNPLSHAHASYSIAAVATDVLTHLPPGTLSGVIYLSGVPSTSTVGEMAAPPLVSVLPGLVSNESVSAYQAAAAVFTERLFAQPDAVSYAVRCMHMGHSLTPEIMALSLSRPQNIDKLWEAGQAGLPLLSIQGTLDGHREGGPKSIDDIMRPHFKKYESIWLEGRGHALHSECPNEVVEHLITFTKKVNGKVRYIHFSWLNDTTHRTHSSDVT